MEWWSAVLDNKNVYGAFSCYPNFADMFGEEEENFLKIALADERVKAVGEMGLDYSYKYAFWHA